MPHNDPQERLLSGVGAANQSRTDDLILTKDVLYQLSHSSNLYPLRTYDIISNPSVFVKGFEKSFGKNFEKVFEKIEMSKNAR